MPRLNRGMVQIYTGNGKGKTTAALGLAFRAAGHGYRSKIIQFMKGQIRYGELKSAKRFKGLIEIVQCGRAEFVDKKNPARIDIEMAQKALQLAKREMKKGEVDLLILDEICCALDYKLVKLSQVLELLKLKPEKMEMVLTGRYAPKSLCKKADLVTEMREVKHYWRKRVSGRKGIEF